MNLSIIQWGSSKVASLFVAVFVFLVFNLTANEFLSKLQLDLTEHKLYTLSEGSEFVLNHLSEPINLDLFISKSELIKFPALHAYASRVEDVIKTYAQLADGMIRYRVIETEAFSDAEDLAIRNGLVGIPGDFGNSIYFGLVGSNTVDDVEIISLFLPEREELLEYELTYLISKLNSKKQRTIGILSSLPIHLPPPGAADPGLGSWAIFQQLTNFFNVNVLDVAREEIPKDLDLLVVIHPVNFTESLIYEIDQFALSGKSVLILVDPYSEVMASLLAQLIPKDFDNATSDINILTENWGVKLVTDRIVGDLPIAARVVDSSSSTPELVDFPLWMNVQPEQMNFNDVVTSKIGNIFMATAGQLELISTEKIEVTPLILSTKEATLIDTEEIIDSFNFKELLQNYNPLAENFVIAARIRGEANSAFPRQITDANNESDPKHRTKGEINAIVIADTDFLHDRFWVTTQQLLNQIVVFPQASNGELVLNSINNLANNEALIGIRSRGGYARPFDRIQKIRQTAERRFHEEEERLEQELESIERSLIDFETDQSNKQTQTILTQEQQQMLKQIQTTRSVVRTKLREVRRNLNQDIQNLKQNVILINALLAPLMVIVLGIYVAMVGSKNRDKILLREVKTASRLR